MFHTISWAQYLTLLGGASAVYYGWIFWKWFPNERAALGLGKRKENGEGLTAPEEGAGAGKTVGMPDRLPVAGSELPEDRIDRGQGAGKEAVRKEPKPLPAGQRPQGPAMRVAEDGKLLGRGEGVNNGDGKPVEKEGTGEEGAGSAPGTQEPAGIEQGLRVVAHVLTEKIAKRVQLAAETDEAWPEMKFALRQLCSEEKYQTLWEHPAWRQAVRDAVAKAIKEKRGKEVEEVEVNEVGEMTFFV